MYRLLYTDNIGFDMSDWERKQIRKVFAAGDIHYGETFTIAVENISSY